MASLNRRSLFAGATAAAAVGPKIALGAEAPAAGGPMVVLPSDLGAHLPINYRGMHGYYERLAELDVESRGDFFLGMSVFNYSELQQAASQRAVEILKGNGVAPDEAIPFEKAIALLSPDPVLTTLAKSRSTHQAVKYRMLQRELHRRADEYLSALEAADKTGPGMVELETGLVTPEYCRREIHTQPGGYVGDPFAGYMYRYGTDWGVLTGRNYQDEFHLSLAANVPLPADRKVRRALDLGTSIGQLATALKMRFPECEVWGIDAGPPMVRYAHLKAVQMNVAVNFSHRLAEDTKFPNNHFDIVTANILFHEVTSDAARQIVHEVARILRPGGVFYPIDFYTAAAPPRTAWQHFGAFWNHRWNNEDWMLEYATVDLAGEMRKAGLKVEGGPASPYGGKSNIKGIKI